MHEVTLANRVLSALRTIAAEHNAKVLEVNLQVGELNEPRALHLWLKKLGSDEFKSTKFKITQVPLSIKCKCGYSGKADLPSDTHSPEPEIEILCPRCGGHEISLTSGRELEIIDVKMKKEVRKCRKKYR
jgi:Zn finger protein HypA/HybF involved in hydrogenase expression